MFTTSNNVTRGNATYTSAAFTPALPGTYNWVATYNGDGNNAAFTEPCGSTNESVTVNQFAPTLTTQASAGVVVGGDMTDTATLSGGGLTPTGTITFTAYGPGDPTCATRRHSPRPSPSTPATARTRPAPSRQLPPRHLHLDREIHRRHEQRRRHGRVRESNDR